MIAHRTVWTSAILLTVVSLTRESALADEAVMHFESRVRPVLIESCFQCHGGETVEGGLRLDSRVALLNGGDSGAAIVPGRPDDSLLVQAVRRTHRHIRMPPKSPLPHSVVENIVRWIDAGAPWPAYDPAIVRTTATPKPLATLRPNDDSVAPGLQLWLRTDGRPWQDGQSIYLWEDSSGRGHDLAATAGARAGGTGQPATFVQRSHVGGFPAVRFHAETGLGGNAASAPGISGNAEFTMFVVARMDAEQPTAEGLIAGFGEPAFPGNPGRPRSAILGVQPKGSGRPIFVGGWGNDAAPIAPLKSVWLGGPPTIIVLSKQPGPLAKTSRCFLNGTDIGSFGGHQETPDFGRRDDLGFIMGRVQNWAGGFRGDVAEVVLYNQTLQDDERRAVEAHLSAKFRIPLATDDADNVVLEGDPAFHTPHWSFVPVVRPELPSVSESEIHSGHPVDRFVHARRREQGLRVVGQADARTLVRRLYFDLHGLPPSPKQMDAAVTSLTPWNDDEWGRLIDALLESSRYGERWGRHWLDVARYADTAGDNADYPVPEIRLYRDYVIDAFNDDMPYDQFVREQLAGDILAKDAPQDRYAEQVTATGFLAISRRYATAPYELWHLTLEDTIDTVGQAFMGMTLRCARCHDHKFDPVTQRDYYALYGIFDSTDFPWAGGEEFESKKLPRQKFTPLLPASAADPLLQAHQKSALAVAERMEDLEQHDPLASALAKRDATLKSLRDQSASPDEIQIAEQHRNMARQQLDAKKEALKAPFDDAARIGYPPQVPSAYAVHDGIPRPAVLHVSGDPRHPGPTIPRGVPQFLAPHEQPVIPAGESGRRQLAEWLTATEHPLTARVMVNRVWHHHFGRGLVATPSNLGKRGAAPSHPNLLDWLASEFREQGWSLKSLHRTILTSDTWKLASSSHEFNATRDPQNAFLWRHSRRRLSAEAIRDSLLIVSGRLNPERPGAHPFAPIPSWRYTQHNQFREFFPSVHRSVYLMTSRLQRHPFLALFDGPDTNTTTGRRTSAIVPSQALYLMNSEEITTEAESFARRLLPLPPERRFDEACALAFQRSPTAAEADRAAAFLEAFTQQADELTAWTSLARTLLTSHEFFYTD